MKLWNRIMNTEHFYLEALEAQCTADIKKVSDAMINGTELDPETESWFTDTPGYRGIFVRGTCVSCGRPNRAGKVSVKPMRTRWGRTVYPAGSFHCVVCWNKYGIKEAK